MSSQPVSNSGAAAPVAPLASGNPRSSPAVFLRDGMFWALSAVVMVWVLLFNEVRAEWQLNPQYNFGWVVPFLGVSLLWRRWLDRPPASASIQTFPPLALGAALLFLILPLRLALEANPEWRLLYWLHGFQALGLSCCLLHGLGGWSWVRFFLPPLLFMLVAIPWPMGLESGLIQGLMRVVAGMTVETTGWLGIPAVQRGNLIEVRAGIVGIDEACSGVNSLQSALMISLFLGEQNRFKPWLRGALLAGSLVFVIIANLMRTTLLVWITAHHGMKVMEEWHDTAGLLVMVAVLLGMFGLAWGLKPRRPATSAPENPGETAPRRIPLWTGMAAAGWLLLSLLATEFWYRAHESGVVAAPRWGVQWPSQNEAFSAKTLPSRSLAILRCSTSEAASWQDQDGNQWEGFFLRWEPGRNSVQLAKGHSPEICFPAAGARLADDFGRVTVDVQGLEMSFRHQTFEAGSKLLHVFYHLGSDGGSDGVDPKEDGSQLSRIHAVMAGRRNLGQQALELVVQGPESPDAALDLLKSQLPHLVKRG